jgi:hypothetical protein
MRGTIITHSRAGLFALLIALSVSACATPDLGPFAEQTANLKAAIVSEQTEIKTKHISVTELTKAVYGSSECPDELVKIKDEDATALSSFCKARRASELYKLEAAKIEASLTIAVAYSEKLKEVAEAGETGDEAFVEILGTVRDTASTVGAVVPGVAAAGGIFEKIGATAADLITKHQANRTLLEAMDISDTLWIEIMEADVKGLYSRTGSQTWMAKGLASSEMALRNSETGIQLLGFYNSLNVDGRPDTRFQRYLGDLRKKISKSDPSKWICEGAPQDDEECIREEDLQTLSATYQILGMMAPRYEKHTDRIVAALKWEAARAESAERIYIAVSKWREEHAKITEYLRKCAAFEDGIFECKKLNFATLKSLTDSLKATASKSTE